MRREIPSIMIFVLCLTLVLGIGLFAQVKKDQKSGLDRIEGTVQALDKDKSTLTLLQSGATKASWHVAYNDKTIYTMRNQPAKAADLKEGLRVIVLGKFEKEVLTAARIDIRTEK
jgi:hypothetical protein